MVVPSNYEKSHQISQHGHQDGNTEDIVLFFNLFNEILQKVSGNPEYKFNLHYFLCDEEGANHKAIKTVYGEDFCKASVVGCQWHFRSDATKQS